MMAKGEPVSWCGSKHVRVVPDFYPRAAEMRAVFEERFRSPRTHARERFVWDYWHIPKQYTYLRTFAHFYFPGTLYNDFVRWLRAWGEQNLGCSRITEPWLSYYINGCRQELHTDVPHGPWAFVFSLTHWDQRKFRGGETTLIRPSSLDYWSGFRWGQSVELDSLVEEIPSLFNQLTVFDPRIPHGVATVEGCQDPLESRLVVHGWFTEPGLAVQGSITIEGARSLLESYRAKMEAEFQGLEGVVGLLVAWLNLNLNGTVQEVEVLTDTLVSIRNEPSDVEQALQTVAAFLMELKFPPVSEPSWVKVPIKLPFSS